MTDQKHKNYLPLAKYISIFTHNYATDQYGIQSTLFKCAQKQLINIFSITQ